MKTALVVAACLVPIVIATAENKEQNASQPAAPIETSIDELMNTVLTNEARFDLQFRNRLLEVTGAVVRVTKTDDESSQVYVVHLEDGGLSPAPVFTFPVTDDVQKELSELQPRQHVTIRCVTLGPDPSNRLLRFTKCKLLTAQKAE